MIISGHDAIHLNIGRLPGGQAAGYTTGSAGIRWTNDDFNDRPGTVRIDQDFAASDPSADVLDVENGAATFADCPVWAKKAKADYAAAVRPGQREPAIYFSLSNVHNVVNALVGGGVTSGVGLFPADWGIGMGTANEMIAGAGGPFPIVAVQYNNGAFYDFDLFSNDWLTNVSGVFARNPVGNLRVTRHGFTNMDLAWDGDAHATGYTVHALYKGAVVRTETTTRTIIRMPRLKPLHSYTFTVRAHPGHSTGLDATVKAVTR